MKVNVLRAGIVAALGGSISSQVALAQGAGGLEEIIVTAEFREANVQDTPISITAVNADMLEARSQTNLFQITAQTPNVSLRPAGSSFGSALVAFIRGIGQTDFNPSVEPGVGIYVDDVYYSTITGNLLDLLDLDRVEVLRGPQGTLAGRNAIGGAIKLFTRKADGAADGVASCQRPLRSAQHLDAVEVEKVEQVARDRRVVDVVDVDADAGLDGRVEVRLTDAANERDERATERGARGAQGNVRSLRGDLREIRLAARIEHVRVDGRDGDRRVLHVGRAELCGDDDLLEIAFLRPGDVRAGRRTGEHGNDRRMQRCPLHENPRVA
jgi:outer membrane cobalamin receptor